MSAPCPTCGGPVERVHIRARRVYCSRRCKDKARYARWKSRPKPPPVPGCEVTRTAPTWGPPCGAHPIVDHVPGTGLPLCAKHAAERARLLGGPCDDPDGCPHEPPFAEAS